jgi:hypothetical protein
MAFKGTIITSKAELFKELDAAPCAKVTAIFRDKTDPALKASRASPASRTVAPLLTGPVRTQEDQDVALKAVSLNGMALQFCPPELQNSPAVVRAALEQTSFAMRYASDEVKASRDVIMAAVSASGKMLVHAHPSLREDEEVVLAAVKQDGMALGYASEELRARSELVRVAVAGNGGALRYASSQIRANRELVLLAIEQDAKAVQYASTVLQMDPDVQRLVTLGQLRGAVPSHGASAQLVYISTGPPLLC